MRRILFLLLIILPSLAIAQETIVSYDKSSLSVLNEELRQSSSGLKTLRGQVADILPIDLSDSTNITGVLLTANSPAIDTLLPSQTGNSGKFLTSNGSTASWGSVSSFNAVYVADTTATYKIASLPAVKGGYGSQWMTYTKVKEFVANGTGTIYTTFTLFNASGGTPYGRIYKNGVAVGTERSGNGTYTETISVATGDLVQLYIKQSRDDYYVQVKDLFVYATQVQINMN